MKIKGGGPHVLHFSDFYPPIIKSIFSRFRDFFIFLDRLWKQNLLKCCFCINVQNKMREIHVHFTIRLLVLITLTYYLINEFDRVLSVDNMQALILS